MSEQGFMDPYDPKKHDEGGSDPLVDRGFAINAGEDYYAFARSGGTVRLPADHPMVEAWGMYGAALEQANKEGLRREAAWKAEAAANEVAARRIRT